MAEAATKRSFSMLFPSLHGYSRSWLRGDTIAGLTVWAVLVPESLAYATIAGVPPVVGLYAAFPALVLYAAFGSSRHLVVGPMSGTAALSAGVVGTFARGNTPLYLGLTTALALVVGVVALVAGLMRLGFLSSFISEPVMKGFIIGLALTIIIGQVPKLFGIESGAGDFFEKLFDLVKHLPDTSVVTMVVGLGSLALVVALKRWFPLLPGSLIAVLLGIAAVSVFNLDQHGVAIVGHIPSGLPRVGLPQNLDGWSSYAQLVGPAFGVLLVGFAEALGAAKTYARREGYEIDANRELIGMGVANIGTGLASGMVVNGSLSKTSVNGGAGAKSQLSGLVVAVMTILTLLLLTGLFENLPEATLGAVVIAAVIELVDYAALRRLSDVWTKRLGAIYGPAARADLYAAVAALLGVLLFDTLPGLFIGIAVSMLLLLYRSSRPNVSTLGRVAGSEGMWADVARHETAVVEPDVAVARVESGLFFANADHVREQLEARVGSDRASAIVLDAEAVAFLDVTAAAMLVELAESLDRQGLTLVLARDIGQVRDVIRRASPHDRLTQPYVTIDQAIAAVRAQRAGGGT